MDKKGIAEIKRTFKPDKTAIDQVVTAFVKVADNDLEMVSFDRKTLLSMDDVEVYKYLEIAKQTLGGKLDKNLFNIDFSLDIEQEEDGSHAKLMKLRENKLMDNDFTFDFIEHLMGAYTDSNNYMVTLMHGTYDVPTKCSDGATLNESDSVFDFIIGSIMPLKMEKAGMYLNPETNKFETIPQKMIVDKPINGFMFPAFNERATDIHQLVFFTKKADRIHPELIDTLTGSKAPVPAAIQKDIFSSIVKEVVGDTTFEEEKAIHDNIVSVIENRAFGNDTNTELSKDDTLKILKNSIDADIDETKFNDVYDQSLRLYSSGFALENIIDISGFDVKMNDVKIKIAPDKTDLIKQVEINGGKYFAIPVSRDVEINGKPVVNTK